MTRVERAREYIAGMRLRIAEAKRRALEAEQENANDEGERDQ